MLIASPVPTAPAEPFGPAARTTASAQAERRTRPGRVLRSQLEMKAEVLSRWGYAAVTEGRRMTRGDTGHRI